MKKFISGSLGALLLTILFISAVSAQEISQQPIRGGVLNGKAIKLPAPKYPEDAKMEGAGGPVSVDIKVDEDGNVFQVKGRTENKVAASDANGGVEKTKTVHPSLVAAAEQAAWQAKFSPTNLNGNPVKISGTIIYNFVPGDKYDGATTLSGPFGGGVLNGKAVNLPTPAYPTIAANVKASGSVAVQVTIDESGNVISATAVSGHPLLRASAVEAAKQATFSPTLLSGTPVKVAGILMYNFSAPE